MKYAIFFLILFPNFLFSQKSFKYYNFEQPELFELLGNASISNKNIRLTPSAEWQRGACWYKNKVTVLYGFEVNFKMAITKHSKGFEGKGADGLAFVIQNYSSNIGLGEAGEGLGYAGLANCLAVEFDTFNNDEGSNNHVSIQTNKKGKVSRFNDNSIAINHKIPDLRNTIKNVKITYDFKYLRVFMDGKLYLEKEVHLEKTLKLDDGKAWIGFTAATAAGFSQHEILEWHWQMNKRPIVEVLELEKMPLALSFLSQDAILRRRKFFFYES